MKFFLGFFVFGVVSSLILQRIHAPVSVDTVRELVEKCSFENTETVECFRRAFSRLVRPQTLESIMVALESYAYPDRVLGPNESAPECHQLGHIVGEIAGSQQKASIAQLMLSCGRRCGYGCAHGVIVGHIRKDPSRIDNLESMCMGTNDVMTKSAAIACNHGVGHAVAELASYSLSGALESCDSFLRQEAREECWTGAFMEVYEPPTRERSLSILPDDMYGFCYALGAGYKNFCLKQLITIGYKASGNIDQAFSLCRTLPSIEREKCATGIGADVFFLHQSNIDQIVYECQKGERLFDECIQGVILSSLVIDATGARGSEICGRVDVSETVRCLSNLQKEREQMNREIQ